MSLKNNTRANPELGAKLDELAKKILASLIAEDMVTEGTVTGFRAISAYYAMVNKLPPEEEEGATAFNGFKDALDGTRARARGKRTARARKPVAGDDEADDEDEFFESDNGNGPEF